MTIYYVDKSTGADGDSGLTPDDAWETCSKVSGSTFSAGDIIRFKCGEVWRESLTVNQNGTRDALITYRDYGTGALPKITGADDVSTWVVDAGNVYVASLVYSGTIYLLLEDGVPLIPVVDKAAITSAGKFWFDDGNDDIYCWATDDADPDTHTMEAGVRYNTIVAQDRSNIMFKNLHIEGGGGQWGRGLQLGSATTAASNLIVDGCHVSGCWYTGIWGNTDAAQTPVDGVQIMNCTVDNCAVFGIRINGENAGNRAPNCSVVNCFIFDCGVDTDDGGHGLYLQYCAAPLVKEVKILDCQGQWTWGGGMYLDNCPDAEISYCWLDGNYPNNYHVDVTPNRFVFKHNVSNNSAGVGFVVEEHVPADGTSYIYHNTFYNNDIGLRFGPGGTVFEVTSVIVKNNIFSENTSHNVQIPANSIDAANLFDYNLYYYTGGNKNFNEVGVDWYTLTEWLARGPATWDLNSDDVDPMLIDPANDNLGLQADSPAVDAAEDLRDFSISSIDIGAVEYKHLGQVTTYSYTVEQIEKRVL